MEHTPAPWNINLSRIENKPHKIIIYGQTKRIALCFKEDNSVYVNETEALANAQLIAAAPQTAAERDKLKEINAELLEALEMLVDPSTGKVWEDFRRPFKTKLINKIESAIVKAKSL